MQSLASGKIEDSIKSAPDQVDRVYEDQLEPLPEERITH